MTELRRITIEDEQDVVLCRRVCREAARELGFNLVDQTRITTAASELARNIFEYADTGDVVLFSVQNDAGEDGLRIEFRDKGPGIDNVEDAMGEGWTSHRGMGLGLPGSRKLMDEFEIQSEPGKGTTVIVTKWRR